MFTRLCLKSSAKINFLGLRCFGVSLAKSGKWQQFYESYTKLPSLIESQNLVNKVNEEYFLNQKIRNQCLAALIKQQEKLRDIHFHLDQLPSHDSKYTYFLKEEDQCLNKMRSLSLDFSKYDKADQEKLKELSSALHLNIKIENLSERQRKKLLMFGILTGFLFSFSIVYLLFNWYSCKKELSIQINEPTFRQLVEDFRQWICFRNLSLAKMFQEMKVILGFSEDQCLTFPEPLINSKSETKTFLKQASYFCNQSDLNNKRALVEMNKIRDRILAHQEFDKQPILTIETNPNLQQEGERGLWLTTFSYVSLAIFLPLSLILFE